MSRSSLVKQDELMGDFVLTRMTISTITIQVRPSITLADGLAEVDDWAPTRGNRHGGSSMTRARKIGDSGRYRSDMIKM